MPATQRRRCAVVYNPTKISDQFCALLEDQLIRTGWVDTLWLETSPDDPGRAMTQQALAVGVDLVIGAGGDGTVRIVADGLVEPAMQALTQAWTEDGGQVIGLAPSAAAAAVLGEQTSIRTDTLAKLTWSMRHGDLPDWATGVGPATLIIIDEAGMADTLSLDTAVQFTISRGASVRLIGDDQQLAAIGAGGVPRDIQERHGALQLPSYTPLQPAGRGGSITHAPRRRPDSTRLLARSWPCSSSVISPRSLRMPSPLGFKIDRPD